MGNRTISASIPQARFARSHGRVLLRAALLGLAFLGLALPALGQTLLYDQDFETPNAVPGFIDTTNRDVSQQTVNELYSGQPTGFSFSQAFTVETLEVNGDTAWGDGYSDPAGRGGNYSIGMLATVQDDLLGLTFDVGEFDFLNASFDISGIDLDGVGGPFGSDGIAPIFEMRLVDGPSLTSLAILDSEEVMGTASARDVFDWTNVVVGLDATGSSNGTVTLVIDLLSGGYAALDNFVIVASDIPGEVPEPGTALLLGVGLAALASRPRRD